MKLEEAKIILNRNGYLLQEVSYAERTDFLLDNDELYTSILEIYQNEFEKLCDSADENEKPYYESEDYYVEEFATHTTEGIQRDMYKYVSGNNFKIPGNFKQIDYDWNSDHEDGIKFYELRKKLLEGVKDKDTKEFSTWGIQWFFKAFGTYDIKYKFRDAIVNIVFEQMAEDEEPDEEEFDEDE